MAVAVTLASAVLSFGQNFEGKVIYENKYKSKLPGVTDDALLAMMGNRQEYLIKGGNYKSVFNGTFMQWVLYVNKDNKLYSKMTSSPDVLWNDGAENADEVLKAEVNKGVVDIAGYKCDELVLTCKTGIQKYYFSAKLAVDAKLFEKHKYGNWAVVASRTRAVPLKVYVDNAQFTIDSVAKEIIPAKLEDKEFALPPESNLVKSPY